MLGAAALFGIFVLIGGFEDPSVRELALDQQRIRRHLAGVETDLRARTVLGLPIDRQRARTRVLDELHRYWHAGRFPRNEDVVDARVPVFIDAQDTACAVGHLMLASGAGSLALAVRTRENNAKVHDMTTPGLAAWAEAHGLTIDECARIQPSYCNCSDEVAPVCASDGHTYLNECEAVECAGLEVVHEGECASTEDTDGEGGSGWPMPGTSGTTGAPDPTGGTTTTPQPGDDDGPAPTSAETGSTGDTDGHGEDDGADDGGVASRGCTIGGSSSAAWWLAPLVLVRRRRR